MPRPPFVKTQPQTDKPKPAKSRQEIQEESMAADKKARNNTAWDALGKEVPFSGNANTSNSHNQVPPKSDSSDKFVFRPEDWSIHPPSERPTEAKKLQTPREKLDAQIEAVYQKIQEEGGLNHISATTEKEIRKLYLEMKNLDEAEALTKKVNNTPVNQIYQSFTPQIKRTVEQITGVQPNNPEKSEKKPRRRGLLGLLGGKAK